MLINSIVCLYDANSLSLILFQTEPSEIVTWMLKQMDKKKKKSKISDDSAIFIFFLHYMVVLHYTMICDCQQFLHAYPSQNVNKPLMEFWYIQLHIQQREKATTTKKEKKSRTFHSDVNRLNGTKQTKLNEFITTLKKQKVFVKHISP